MTEDGSALSGTKHIREALLRFLVRWLLGIPIRLIVSERNLANNQIEFKRRDTGESGAIPLDSVLGTIRTWIRSTNDS